MSVEAGASPQLRRVLICCPHTHPNTGTASRGGRQGPAAAAGTRSVLLLCYWALAAVIVPFVLLTLVRSPSGLAESTISCTGDAAETRRCVFTNAVVADGVIWLYSRAALHVPPVLCSAANQPAPYRHLCDVRVSSDPVAYGELLGSAKRSKSFDVAVAVHRLNPTNAYHAVWEDMLPALGMMRWGGGLPADAHGVMRHLRAQKWGVTVVDHMGPDQLDGWLWEELLPEVTVVHPSGAPVRAAKLIAGTAVGCAHWGHCAPLDRAQGTFDPPDAAAAFRELVFKRFGINEEEKSSWKGRGAGAEAETAPRVTVVQRARTRRLRNLEAVVQIVREEVGVEPLVVDMANMTAVEQVTASHNTDVMIMVHGGALVNTMWLPRAALLIDIYPYAFPVRMQSAIVHWIRGALGGLGMGHHPFEVLEWEGQELLSGPITKNCTCEDDSGCQAHVFQSTKYVAVEAGRFREHMKQSLELWRDGRYRAPVGPAEFEMGMKAGIESRPESPQPKCV